jgi:hypothetical protein
MTILRTTPLAAITLVAGIWVSTPATILAQQPAMPKAAMTPEQKIANAVSAGPTAISGEATVLDWPARDGENPVVLRKGTNGWTCLPDMPTTEGSDPMCLDDVWMNWVEAYSTKTTPQITKVGIGYMIAPGGSHGSNTDPYATSPKPDNHWAHHPPHIMIALPDAQSLEGLSTDPRNGGPYVMFKGTPYAHIMAPIAGAMTMPMEHK